MPKLLLIQPPVEDFYDTDIRLQPVGLAYLKAAVKKHLPDWEVVIRDYHQGHGRTTIALPVELAYLKKYYQHPDSSPFSTFHQYYRFGASYDRIGKEIAAENPDIVGISSLFSPYYREALRCAGEIKKRCKATIIVGGSHASCHPQSVLASLDVDFVIRGEGERPLVEFLKAWENGGEYDSVPNLVSRAGSGTSMNPAAENYSLKEIPIPDFSDLPPERYTHEKRPVCMILTSRGCPHRCSFCTVHSTFGSGYRRRNPDDVVREMEERYAEGYRVFDFEDDNLTFDRDGIQELCRHIILRFTGKDIELLAMNGISYKSLDRETLTLMRRAGFTHLNLSLVSSDEKILSRTGRPHRVEQFSETVKIAKSLGFQVVAYQILGLPHESLEGMINTLQFLARHPVLIGVSIFYLTPGAAIAALYPPLREEDIFRARSTAMAIETDDFSRDDLFTLFITARIINFLKGMSFQKTHAEMRKILARKSFVSPREEAGVHLLNRLLAGEGLFAETRQGAKKVSRFDQDLFFNFLKGFKEITTVNGEIIRVF